MQQKGSKKVPFKYICEKCNYYSNRKSQYQRHLQTKKHNTTNTTSIQQKTFHTCICGKSYMHRGSLSNHEKKCSYINNSHRNQNELTQYSDENQQITPSNDFKHMFMKLIEKNEELQQIICEQNEKLYEQNEKLIELAKQPKTIIKKQTNTFNLDNFLNIQCKDAMNLSDFMETIELTFKDLLYLGNNGFEKSIQNTFVKQLKDLDQAKRPIHCTDKKRKTLYVKDDDKWEKDANHNKISNAIQKMNQKQLTAFSKHSEQRPENYLDSDQNINTQHKMITQMCDYNPNTSETYNKKILTKLVDNIGIKK